MKYPYFSTIDKKKHMEIATRGGLKKRTPQVQAAWDNRDNIIILSKNHSLRQIAMMYAVSHSTISRILKSA